MRERLIRGALPSVLSVAAALLLCFAAIAVVAASAKVALDAYLAMVWGGLGDLPRFLDGAGVAVLARPWGEAATKAGLLALTGLSVAVAFKAGLFNIGAQGQMILGAIAAAFLGAQLELPALVHPLLCISGAAVAGGLYGLLPAALKLRRGVHEVISTIMLNWIAVSLVENWLVVGPLRARASGDLSISGTDEIAATAQLPRLLGETSRLHAGFLVAVAAAVLLHLWLSRTRLGFETRAVGLAPEAARASGIPVHGRIYQAMALSGALAGMAGALLVLGTEHKFPATIGAPYGFDGIAIALIGQNHPLGVLATALLFGALRAGGTRMQLFGVHKSFPELIQGLALLFVAGRMVWDHLLALSKRKRPAEEAPRA
ncbi:MAG: ABC transporter permease [Myxococcales bacterium]|nr:ABC transporter permease [Myxococcales bacterium]